jgi:hypothetical protein
VLPLLYWREALSTSGPHCGWEDRGHCCSVCEFLSCYLFSTGLRLSRPHGHTAAGRKGDPADRFVTYSRVYLSSTSVKLSRPQAHNAAGITGDPAVQCVTYSRDYLFSTSVRLSRTQDNTATGRTGDAATQCVTYSRVTSPQPARGSVEPRTTVRLGGKGTLLLSV